MKITVTVQDDLLQLSRTLDPDKPDDWTDQIESQIASVLRAKAALEKPPTPAAPKPEPKRFTQTCPICCRPLGQLAWKIDASGFPFAVLDTYKEGHGKDACCSDACARKLAASSPPAPSNPSPLHHTE
jgi:hypothetical protein